MTINNKSMAIYFWIFAIESKFNVGFFSWAMCAKNISVGERLLSAEKPPAELHSSASFLTTTVQTYW